MLVDGRCRELYDSTSDDDDDASFFSYSCLLPCRSIITNEFSKDDDVAINW